MVSALQPHVISPTFGIQLKWTGGDRMYEKEEKMHGRQPRWMLKVTAHDVAPVQRPSGFVL